MDNFSSNIKTESSAFMWLNLLKNTYVLSDGDSSLSSAS